MEKIGKILKSNSPLDIPEGDLPDGFGNPTDTESESESQTTESEDQNTESDSQNTESEGQSTESESQATEEESQATENEGQSTESEGQDTEGESQTTEADIEIEQETEVFTETQEPPAFITDIGNRLKDSPILCGALGVVLTLLLVVIADSVRKKKAAQPSQEEPVSTEETIQEQLVTISQNETDQTNTTVRAAVKAAKVCGIGQRDDQQDSYGITDSKDIMLYHKRGQLAVVADGMGGLSNGGEISSLVVKCCHNIFHELPEYMNPADMLLEMAKSANRNVNLYLKNGQRSGSTLVSAIIRDGYLYFLTIGDSHIYLYRKGALLTLNREHVYREELAVSAVNGEVSMERVKSDPQAKSLTSYLGVGNITHIDRNEAGIRLVKGDRILLCSDGVYGTISQKQIEAALHLDVQEAVKQIQEMIEKAEKPYQDNYTAVVLEYQGME